MMLVCVLTLALLLVGSFTLDCLEDGGELHGLGAIPECPYTQR